MLPKDPTCAALLMFGLEHVPTGADWEELCQWGPSKYKSCIIQMCWGWRHFSSLLGQLRVSFILWGDSGHSEVDTDCVVASRTTIPTIRTGKVGSLLEEGWWHHPAVLLGADPGLGTRSCSIPNFSPTHGHTEGTALLLLLSMLTASFSFSVSLL